jgi:hypothetical protein
LLVRRRFDLVKDTVAGISEPATIGNGSRRWWRPARWGKVIAGTAVKKVKWVVPHVTVVASCSSAVRQCDGRFARPNSA